MLTEFTPDTSALSFIGEVPAGIRSRVMVAEPALWVKIHEVDESFRPRHAHQQVLLLLDSQHHSCERAFYYRCAQRLETLQAVQHLSQWRLDFDPPTQEVIIHSIAIKRGEQRIEHASMDRLRFLRREQQMESLVIDGRWTLVLLLEDVRVGDLLDVSYTIITNPRILRQRYSILTHIPWFASVRSFHFSILFPQGDGMRWVANDIPPSPGIQTVDGDGQWRPVSTEERHRCPPAIETLGEEVQWAWSIDHIEAAEIEPGIPLWHAGSKYIHVSNCESWQEVASGVAAVWPGDSEQPELARFAKDLLEGMQELSEVVEKAIEFVQDEIRYLSVNEDFGGQIPASPDVVLQRRFGDCKDKALLLARLLKQIGVEARPILVNVYLRGAVREMLPSQNVFNHAIVEFSLGDHRRWVDATISMQGGGALNRPPVAFKVGLAVDANTSDLCDIDSSQEGNSYKVCESFHLDTAGGRTVLEVTCVATGTHAENLRRSLAAEGVDAMAKSREQFYRRVFPEISRIEKLKWKDDRRGNRLALAECFDLGKIFPAAQNARFFRFLFHSHVMQSVLLLPEGARTRKNPFVMAGKGTFEHEIDFHLPAMVLGGMKSLHKRAGAFIFSAESRKIGGNWTWNYTLNVTDDVVEKDAFEAHRNAVLEVWPSTGMSLSLPMGASNSRNDPSPDKILSTLSWTGDRRRSSSATAETAYPVGRRSRPSREAVAAAKPIDAAERIVRRMTDRQERRAESRTKRKWLEKIMIGTVVAISVLLLILFYWVVF